MSWIQRLMANLAEIFSPLIPAIIIGGLILGFRNVIGDIKMFEDGTKTLVEISQFWSGVHSFLWFNWGSNLPLLTGRNYMGCN